MVKYIGNMLWSNFIIKYYSDSCSHEYFTFLSVTINKFLKCHIVSRTTVVYGKYNNNMEESEYSKVETTI